MLLTSLGYVALGTARLDQWADFATGLLGMQVADRGAAGLTLRTDARAGRLFLDAAAHDAVEAIGWEVADGDALAALAARLADAGHRVEPGSPALADRRGVRALILAQDPAGNRLEFFHGAADAGTPFQPGRSISGFRTGPLGLGHAVLTTRSIDALLPFYCDLLGFRLSDTAPRPFRASFFHLNARHHSFAMVETGAEGFHHLMVELNSLDDVGQGYDLAQLEDGRVAVTMGRHTNDYMTSFYMRSPSGIMVEYGWGGRSIDPATWEPFECDHGPSLWGHERAWLDEAGRAQARALRLAAAAAGRRAPDFVLGSNDKQYAGGEEQ